MKYYSHLFAAYLTAGIGLAPATSAQAQDVLIEQRSTVYESPLRASAIATLEEGHPVSIVREDYRGVIIAFEQELTGFLPLRYLSTCGNGDPDCRIATTIVNVRSGMGTTFPRLGQLSRGDQIEVLQILGSFAEIRQSVSRKGWTDRANLSLPVVNPQGAREPQKGDSTTVRSPLALRSRLSGGYTVQTLQPGDAVEVRENDGRYALVAVPTGVRGFMPRRYLHPCQSGLASSGCFVATTTVNVRNGKGVQFKRTGQLRAGDKVQVDRVEGEYAYVRGGDVVTGWVLTAGLQGLPELITEDPLPGESTIPEGALPSASIAEAEPAIESTPETNESAIADASAGSSEPETPVATSAARGTPRFSIRLAAGLGTSEDKALDIQRFLEDNGTEGRVRGYDDVDTTIELSARYALWRGNRLRLGVELGYLDMGTYLIELTPGNTSAADLARVLAENQPVGDEGLIIGGFSEASVASWLHVSAGIGAFIPFDTELVLEFNNERGTANSPEAGVLLSGGLTVPVGHAFALGLYLRAVRLNSWVVSSAAGLEYRF